MLNIEARNPSHWVDWIQSDVKSSICDTTPRGLKKVPTFIENTTRIDGRFSKMSAWRAFVHSYVNECLETVEFDEQGLNMTDLIEEYKSCETAGVEEVGECEEDEDEAA
jgi:tubulin beta